MMLRIPIVQDVRDLFSTPDSVAGAEAARAVRIHIRLAELLN